jgi:lysophospholipase L1-like esterase
METPATPSSPATPSDAALRRKKRRRLRLRIAFWGIFLFCALFLYLFYIRRPVGSGPAGPTVPRADFERTWTRRPTLLLGLGDSVTEGYGASAGKGYFDRLFANPPDEFEDMRGISLSAVIPELTKDNRALSGSTSLQHMQWQVEKLPVEPPERFGIVVMTTGGNDIIHDYGRSPPAECAMFGATLAQAQPWIANYERRLDAMLSMVTAKFPGGCEIFLGNIYDPTDGAGAAHVVLLPSWPDCLKVLAEYNGVIARVAARHANVHLVDLHTLFMGHGITCAQFWRSAYRPDDPHYWFSPVFEDPNDRGYDAARRAFLLKMAQVLRPGPAK